MSASRLLEYYDRVIEAPNAISRLRRLILDLAVRGKIVRQDANDESVQELLQLIERAKSGLVDAGLIRKPRTSEAVGIVNGAPFAIPATWRWVRLDEVGAIIGGGTPSAGDTSYFAEPGRGIPWLTPADLGGYSHRFISHGARDLSEIGLKHSSATLMPAGTVLFTSRAPIGYVAIASNSIATNQGFKSVVPYCKECARFIATVLTAFAPRINATAPGTTFKEVSGKIVASIAFPLPPLAEQHRIVAKVDELMALCDEITAERSQRETIRDRFTSATLARVNTPDTDAVSFAEHARYAIHSLNVLTTRPDQVTQFRETILNLAVRGKLVPQDPKDEPASELLKRLGAEKSRSSRRNGTFDVIKEGDEPFKCPSGWQWARMGDVFSIRTGFAFQSSTYAERGTLVLRVTNFDRNACFDLSNSVYFPTEKIDAKLSNFLLLPGEIIMVMVGGTIGKTIIVDETVLPALLNQNMWRIRSFGAQMSNKFEYLLVRHSNQLTQSRTKSTHGHFAMSDYELRPIAIPPLAEQRRIVAKVDELLMQCDQLEASLVAGGDARRHLLDALIAEALTTTKCDDARKLEFTEVS